MVVPFVRNMYSRHSLMISSPYGSAFFRYSGDGVHSAASGYVSPRGATPTMRTFRPFTAISPQCLKEPSVFSITMLPLELMIHTWFFGSLHRRCSTCDIAGFGG